MPKPNLEININRRQLLFKIVRVATSKLIKGEYQFPAVSEISAEDLNEHINAGHQPVLIDVRSADEFNAGYGHLPHSKQVPLMELVGTFNNFSDFKASIKDLEGQLDEILPAYEEEIVTICPGGGFSLVAAEMLAEAGYKDVKSLSGGSDGWFKKGFPTSLT